MKLIQHANYKGVFQPVRTDDLKAGMAELIGQEFTMYCGWPIEEDDHSEYVGDMAMIQIKTPDGSWVDCTWMPSRDFTNLTRV